MRDRAADGQHACGRRRRCRSSVCGVVRPPPRRPSPRRGVAHRRRRRGWRPRRRTGHEDPTFLRRRSAVGRRCSASDGVGLRNRLLASARAYRQRRRPAHRGHRVHDGRDIHFAPGAYRPAERSGMWLLGHELTHVVQQTGATAMPDNDLGVHRHFGSCINRHASKEHYMLGSMTPAQIRSIADAKASVEAAKGTGVVKAFKNLVSGPDRPPPAALAEALQSVQEQLTGLDKWRTVTGPDEPDPDNDRQGQHRVQPHVGRPARHGPVQRRRTGVHRRRAQRAPRLLRLLRRPQGGRSLGGVQDVPGHPARDVHLPEDSWRRSCSAGNTTTTRRPRRSPESRRTTSACRMPPCRSSATTPPTCCRPRRCSRAARARPGLDASIGAEATLGSERLPLPARVVAALARSPHASPRPDRRLDDAAGAGDRTPTRPSG